MHRDLCMYAQLRVYMHVFMYELMCICAYVSLYGFKYA